MALIKISSIPQLYRNVNRWREILAILSKYGLANWVSQLGVEFAKDLFKDASGEALARLTQEARIRLALTELGPTFIKLGQVLSTRADLIGVRLAEELQTLQADAPADPAPVVRATIEAELGEPIDDLFAAFDDRPIASASIGQCHAARLKTGEEVVVKVQHPGIENKIRVDLDILMGLAQLANKLPDFANYRPAATVAEFQRTLLRELDFGREERNMQQFRANFSEQSWVRIPRPYPELTTSRVLTMERLEGIKLTDRQALSLRSIDLVAVARRCADLYMEMIFNDGFYHADPHPGNLMIVDGDVVGLLDYGMVGRVDEQLQEDFEEMLLAIGNRDAAHLTSLITRIGQTPANLDRAALSLDVADFVSHYTSQRMDEFDLSGALNEMVEMIRRYHIMLPARVAMLIKLLVMLEGTSRLMQPRFNLIEIMAPYQRRMAWRRLSPARQARKFRRFYSEIEHLANVLPRGIVDMVQQMQSGKFDVHLHHRALEPSVNRLVYGMLASALFLGSSLLLSSNVPPLVRGLPLVEGLSLLGLAGCTMGILLGLRLIRAINKSGHLDRRG